MVTNQLTFTRFIAAISIVVFHFGDIYAPFNAEWVKPLVHHANLGVSYFFVLSGFVMVLAYGRKEQVGFVSFIRNRIARILPLYYLAILMMLAYLFIRLYILKIPHVYTPSIIDTVLNVLMLQAWFPEKATTLNTAAWSLSVEALFYLLFPIIINHIKSIKVGSVVFIAVLFNLISQLISWVLIGNLQANWFLYHPLLHLNSFIVGIAFGMLFLKYRHRLGKIQIFALLSVSVLILFMLYFPVKGVVYHNGLLSIPFALFILFLAVDQSIVSRMFNHRFLIYLGEISYGIYILQFPVFIFLLLV